MPIRVVLADDNYLLREGVRQLIETQPELELVAVAADLESQKTELSDVHHLRRFTRESA